MDSRCRCFLVKMYVKMKELGPVGGGVHHARPPLDPPRVLIVHSSIYLTFEVLQNSIMRNFHCIK